MNDFLNTVRPYLSTEIFLLALVLGVFYLGIIIYQKTKITLLQPLLTAMVIIIPFLMIFESFYDFFSLSGLHKIFSCLEQIFRGF